MKILQYLVLDVSPKRTIWAFTDLGGRPDRTGVERPRVPVVSLIRLEAIPTGLEAIASTVTNEHPLTSKDLRAGPGKGCSQAPTSAALRIMVWYLYD